MSQKGTTVEQHLSSFAQLSSDLHHQRQQEQARNTRFAAATSLLSETSLLNRALSSPLKVSSLAFNNDHSKFPELQFHLQKPIESLQIPSRQQQQRLQLQTSQNQNFHTEVAFKNDLTDSVKTNSNLRNLLANHNQKFVINVPSTKNKSNGGNQNDVNHSAKCQQFQQQHQTSPSDEIYECEFCGKSLLHLFSHLFYFCLVFVYVFLLKTT